MSTAYDLPYLGSVTVEHRLIDYDGPFLFSVRSSNGGRFVGFFAAQSDDVATYWYSAISDKRYKSLLQGAVPIREIFEQPEQGYVLEAQWTGEGYSDTSAFINPKSLDKAALPEPDFFLDQDDYSVASASGLVSANFVALQLHRLVGRIIFSITKNSAPISVVASTLKHLQGVVDSIAFSKTKNPTDFGIIPNAITKQTALSMVPAFGGSFGIELLADTASDMFGSTLEDSFNDFLNLIEVGDDQEKLRPLLSKFKSRTANHYRKLLDSWVELGSPVSIETGAPRANAERTIQLSSSNIVGIVEALYASDIEQPQIEEFAAELIGYNKRIRSFEVKRNADGATYKGKVTGLALASADHATIGNLYTVRIVVVTEYDLMLGKATPLNELIELKPLVSLPD